MLKNVKNHFLLAVGRVGLRHDKSSLAAGKNESSADDRLSEDILAEGAPEVDQVTGQVADTSSQRADGSRRKTVPMSGRDVRRDTRRESVGRGVRARRRISRGILASDSSTGRCTGTESNAGARCTGRRSAYSRQRR